MTTNNDLELDAAKREIMSAFENFVVNVNSCKDTEIDYPEDYTKDEFVNDFLESYYDVRPD